MKELVPSTEFLFRRKVTDLCKELNASAELNPLAGGSSKRGHDMIILPILLLLQNIMKSDTNDMTLSLLSSEDRYLCCTLNIS